MGLNQKFWTDKKILITGNTGFKGSWLSLWLNQLGSELSGFSLEPKNSNGLFRDLKINKKSFTYFGDIRDLNRCKEVVQSSNPEIIIHLAAQALVIDSYLDPISTYETNIIGTANILEASRDCKNLRLVLIVTSDKCYQNTEKKIGYTENEKMGGDDPYSSSKGCAELLTHSYYHSFFRNEGVGIATARAGNVIGGGDWSDNRLIPDFVRAFNSGSSMTVRNPDSIRPWQHVLDPLYGYMLLCEKLWYDPNYFSGGWNFGPDENNFISVKEVVMYSASLWGEKVKWSVDQTINYHEASLLLLNSKKSFEKLSWKPNFSWKMAIEETLIWYKNYFLDKSKIYDLTNNQIKNFMNYE